MDNPVFLVVVVLATGYVMWMWWQDYRAELHGQAPSGPLPGATPASRAVVAVAVAGALCILATEAGGEYWLGTVEEQTDMTVLFAVFTLTVAPFVEELIFRGYLYYDKGSRFLLIASVVMISALFALLHQYMWSFELPDGAPWEFWNARFSLKLDAAGNLAIQGLFSTAMKFVCSLWFYFVLFFPLNRKRSLIPCFAAHAVFNLGVVVVKAVQGKISALY